jgi:hypothetical protein
MWYTSSTQDINVQEGSLSNDLLTSFFVSATTTQIRATTASSSLIGNGYGTSTIPANYLVAGRTIRATVLGVLSTSSTAPNLSIGVKLGNTYIGYAAPAALTASEVKRRFSITFTLSCVTTGDNGTVLTDGLFNNNTTAIVAAPAWELGKADIAQTVSTTIAQKLDFEFKFSNATTTSATSTQVIYETIN